MSRISIEIDFERGERPHVIVREYGEAIAGEALAEILRDSADEIEAGVDTREVLTQ